ncbi:hypothetical protein RCG23_13175 [Neobacillus sp. PS3-34]|uniref:Ig-like domain-containing protein n=1 Tax=Neobacillus sp. PS3-34 TaxID=3070678 RepID=UPI0027DF8A58|nr:Ig-like domain-containing protein [Neobacillus sp. PS3-34]WML46608.1 hypothetical protein RCG23_13175 [Neobacillus sp. PS3-34]
MKKKAIKIAAASAVAASAFVAALPHQADAASNVQSEVSKAVTAMQKAYHTYSDVTATGKFADLADVYKDYNAAKVAYNNAKALVLKAGGPLKDAYLAQLDVNYNEYIAKRVVTYIDAFNYGTTLASKKAALDTALAAKNWDDAEKLYHSISYELKTRTVILDRVYGKTARELLRSEFKASAQALRDSIMHEVTLKMYAAKVTSAIAAKDLDAAKAALDVVNVELTKINKDSEFGKALVAKAAEVNAAYEATQSAKVASVTALNSTTLVVKFNKEIDKTDATSNKFSLEGKTLNTVSVADDNKTVTLTFNNIEGSVLALVVEPIKTKADATVKTDRFVSKLTYSDTVAPSVSNVDYTYSADGKTADATFTFSEPLSTEGTVSVNGTTNGVTYSKDLAKGTVTVTGLTVGSTYKVDFVGAKDVKGNLSNPITQNITVPAQVKDEAKPTASVSVSANKVTLQFSEKVSTLGTVTINGTNYAASFVQDATDATKYVLDAQTAGALNGVNFLNATIVVDGFKDVAGNQGDKVTSSATLTADRTAPAFVSAAVTSDNSKILLTFDGPVAAGDLSATDELVLKVKDGVTLTTGNTTDLTAANVAYGYDVDKNGTIEGAEKNVVAISNALTKGSYSYELAGKAVQDSYGNKVANTLSFALNVADPTTTPGTPTAVVNFSSVSVANGVITVTYNKEMGDSALVASNYKFAGNTLPSTATLKFINSRQNVQITLPDGYIAVNGTYAFEVTGVTDKDNNTLVNGKATAFVDAKENIAPTATKVNVLSSKTFSVDFSEALTDTNTVSGVTVKVNGVAVTGTLAVVGGKLQFTATNDFAATDAITVEFAATNNLTDLNGNSVKTGTVTK